MIATHALLQLDPERTIYVEVYVRFSVQDHCILQMFGSDFAYFATCHRFNESSKAHSQQIASHSPP